jgi:hypothetical protein
MSVRQVLREAARIYVELKLTELHAKASREAQAATDAEETASAESEMVEVLLEELEELKTASAALRFCQAERDRLESDLGRTSEDLERYLSLGKLPKTEKSLYQALKPGGLARVWSTYHFEQDKAGNSTHRLFVTPLGQSGQGKQAAATIADTNLREGAALPGRAEALFSEVSVELVQMGDDEAEYVRENGVLFLDLIQMRFDLLPLGSLQWDQSGRAGRGSLSFAKSVTKDLPEGNGSWSFSDKGLQTGKNALFTINLSFGDEEGEVTGRVRVTLIGKWLESIEVASRELYPSGICSP